MEVVNKLLCVYSGSKIGPRCVDGEPTLLMYLAMYIAVIIMFLSLVYVFASVGYGRDKYTTPNIFTHMMDGAVTVLKMWAAIIFIHFVYTWLTPLFAFAFILAVLVAASYYAGGLLSRRKKR